MRPLLMALVGVLGAAALGASLIVSSAAADPPGNDGVCEHANSEQPCRPDPQPDKGKDCEAHGQNTDGNEDHCAAVVTPSESPSPSPSPSASPSPSPSPETTPETTPGTESSEGEPSSQLQASSTPGPTGEIGGVQQEAPAALPAAGFGSESSNSTVRNFALAALLMSAGGTLAATLRFRKLR